MHSLTNQEKTVKKLLMGLAAMSMVVPSVASAGTAAQSLSVKSAAAVQPVRTSAKPGEAKAVAPALIVLMLVALGVVVYAIADGDSN
jgi:hypothetical protein